MTFIYPLQKENERINLYKYDGENLKPTNQQISSKDLTDHNFTTICFLDLETTGTYKLEDKIIEIAMKTVVIDRETGNLLSVMEEYESLEDPGIPISDKATLINGITNEMVIGKKIDWDKVETMVKASDLLVAHNANFDRGFLDKYLPISQDKIWACSYKDIAWLSKGFSSSKLELLCIWHGFYYDSHRAMNDVNSMIHLVTHDHYPIGEKPICELMDNSQKPYFKIIAENFKYNPILKDKIKSNGYKWDGDNKLWWKRIEYNLHDDLETEKEWLTDTIYGDYFLGKIEEIPLTEKYKE